MMLLYFSIGLFVLWFAIGVGINMFVEGETGKWYTTIRDYWWGLGFCACFFVMSFLHFFLY